MSISSIKLKCLYLNIMIYKRFLVSLGVILEGLGVQCRGCAGKDYARTLIDPQNPFGHRVVGNGITEAVLVMFLVWLLIFPWELPLSSLLDLNDCN